MDAPECLSVGCLSFIQYKKFVSSSENSFQRVEIVGPQFEMIQSKRFEDCKQLPSLFRIDGLL